MQSNSVKKNTGIGIPLPNTSDCIYLDYNATTPIYPEVAEAMIPYLEHFGNPSSNHPYGRASRDGVQRARAQIQSLLGAQSPNDIYFCSCGTEADNWAIFGTVMAARRRRNIVTSARPPHVVTSAIEHPAVLECLKALQEQSILEYTLLKVDKEGLIDPGDVKAAIRPETVLVSIMHANNEIGSLQPIAQIAALLKTENNGRDVNDRILLHTDAAQSIGKVPIRVEEVGVDLLTVVGHKFGAPKGVAALYIRQSVEIDRYMYGGGQENGKRAGTENVLLIVGMGKAAEIVSNEMSAATQHTSMLRNSLAERLLKGVEKNTVLVNGPKDASKRLPNTLSISFKGVDSGRLLTSMAEKLAASAGAACHSGEQAKVSSVLEAIGLEREWAQGTLRLSVGRHSTLAEVEEAADIILRHLHREKQKTDFI